MVETNKISVRNISVPIVLLVFLYCMFLFYVNIQWYNTLKSSSWVIGYRQTMYLWLFLLFSRMYNNIIHNGYQNFEVFMFFICITIITKTLFFYFHGITISKYLSIMNIMLSVAMMRDNIKNGMLSSVLSALIVLLAVYDHLVYDDLAALNE